MAYMMPWSHPIHVIAEECALPEKIRGVGREPRHFRAAEIRALSPLCGELSQVPGYLSRY